MIATITARQAEVNLLSSQSEVMIAPAMQSTKYVPEESLQLTEQELVVSDVIQGRSIQSE